MTILTDAVTQEKDGTWTFQCPGISDSPCGNTVTGGPPFASLGWNTKKNAVARGQQHFDEHKGLGPMQEIHDFRLDRGLVPVVGGVKVEDL